MFPLTSHPAALDTNLSPLGRHQAQGSMRPFMNITRVVSGPAGTRATKRQPSISPPSKSKGSRHKGCLTFPVVPPLFRSTALPLPSTSRPYCHYLPIISCLLCRFTVCHLWKHYRMRINI
ncbi:hypothetical protein J6590_027991 [Homalodisca vitripennis]|nr:hypothetical protein J6590_027991 [Homalodisca vitripennis]